jgi:hypothetical protein
MHLPDKVNDRWRLIAATALPITLLSIVVMVTQVMAATVT